MMENFPDLWKLGQAYFTGEFINKLEVRTDIINIIIISITSSSTVADLRGAPGVWAPLNFAMYITNLNIPLVDVRGIQPHNCPPPPPPPQMDFLDLPLMNITDTYKMIMGIILILLSRGLSYSNQCTTTCATKTMVCTILFYGMAHVKDPLLLVGKNICFLQL